MKNFKEYLQESAQQKKYEFRVKVAGPVDLEKEAKLFINWLKTMLLFIK